MRHLFYRGRIYLAGVLAAAGIGCACVSTAWAAPSAGEVVMDNVVVRDAAVSGAQVGSLVEGQEVTITGQTTGSDGEIWYAITFGTTGNEREGWVRSDLIEVTDDGEEDDEESSETAVNTPDETASAGTVRVELSDGYVDLSDVPDDAAALVSDRFVACECVLEDGTVSGYQLATADALVSNDAILTNYYYLYGTNEVGDSGWYVYDASQDSLQKSILDMSYSLTEADVDDAGGESGQTETGSLVRMLIAVLGVVCVLLLILAIVFSVRYRRLRAKMEREEELWEQRVEEKKKQRPEETGKRVEKPVERKRPKENTTPVEKTAAGKRPEENGSHVEEPAPKKRQPEEMPVRKKAQEPEQSQLFRQSKESVEIMDLDDMDDADYEEMLGRYLDEHIIPKEEPSADAEQENPPKAPSDDEFSISVDDEDGYDFPVDDNADYDLQDLRTSIDPVERRRRRRQKPAEPKKDADEDDDLKFL